MNSAQKRPPRVTRRQAAEILNTSYENVKRLQRAKQLVSSPDVRGVHRFSRADVEELARRRGLGIKATGELAARVFAMFKADKRFADIVIETQQEPDVIRELWRCYKGGFDGNAPEDALANAEEQKEHERHMAEMDRELERRRRAVLETGSGKKGGDDE